MISLIASLVALSQVLAVSAQCQKSLSWKNEPKLASDLAGRVIYNGLKTPRGLRIVEDTILVIERGVGVTALAENAADCAGGWTKSVIINNADLNHGLVYDSGNIYASTSNQVIRWSYNAATRTVSGDPITVVTGMDTSPDSLFPKTRTLEIQPGYLIVNVGSNQNLELAAVNATHGTAQLRRFSLTATVPSGGFKWLDGELVASGLKNAVGLAVSSDGSKLYATDNGVDDLKLGDVDIHSDNPAEELDVIDLNNLGKYYGYPQCFTSWNLASIQSNLTTGSQFSIDTSIAASRCADASFNVPPRLGFEAHSAPLDIRFYNSPSDGTYAINQAWNGHAFVSFHGSINRDPPVGYGIARIAWSGDAPQAAVDSQSGSTYIIQAPDLTKCPNNCIRPVGLAFDSKGRLFATSDTTGEIFVVESSRSPDAHVSAGFKVSGPASIIVISLGALVAALLL